MGKFANELSTVFEQCDKYKNLVFLDLPAQYYTDFVQQTEAADAETLRELARQYLTSAHMQVVIAGPAA